MMTYSGPGAHVLVMPFFMWMKRKHTLKTIGIKDLERQMSEGGDSLTLDENKKTKVFAQKFTCKLPAFWI